MRLQPADAGLEVVRHGFLRRLVERLRGPQDHVVTGRRLGVLLPDEVHDRPEAVGEGGRLARGLFGGAFALAGGGRRTGLRRGLGRGGAAEGLTHQHARPGDGPQDQQHHRREFHSGHDYLSQHPLGQCSHSGRDRPDPGREGDGRLDGCDRQ